MKYFAIMTALICLASTSAVAKPRASQLQNFSAANAQQRDPYGVYVDGELIGRDPDPNVRAEIRATYGGRYAPVCAAR